MMLDLGGAVLDGEDFLPRNTAGFLFKTRQELKQAANGIARYFRWPISDPALLEHAATDERSNVELRRLDPMLRAAFVMLQYQGTSGGNTNAAPRRSSAIHDTWPIHPCLGCGLYTASYCDTCRRGLCTACCRVRGTPQFSECHYCAQDPRFTRSTAPDMLPLPPMDFFVAPARNASDGRVNTFAQGATARRAFAPEQCSYCGRHGATLPQEQRLMRCSCRRAAYCSSTCQRHHWPLHRTGPCWVIPSSRISAGRARVVAPHEVPAHVAQRVAAAYAAAARSARDDNG